MATANGQQMISCEIRQPRVGIWSADFEADISEEDAADAFSAADDGTIRVTLEHAGASFVGTARSAGAQGAKFTARIVGGTSGLYKSIASKNYQAAAGVKARLILSDILRESGETLSNTVEDSTLDKHVARWSRAEGPAKDAIAELATKLGLSWRVLRDGTIWLGVDTYPTVTVDHVVIGDDDNQTGQQTLASVDEDDSGPLTIDPGCTFNGRKVEQVIHRLARRSFRTELSERTTNQALQAALGSQARGTLYSRAYHGRVSAMNADGTVQVIPDDPKVAGGGLDKVRIWLGVPGTVTVPTGARCVLEFESGDPTKPFVSRFGGGELTELKLGSGSEYLARADRVDNELAAIRSTLNSLITTFNAHGHIFAGFAPGGGSATTASPATPASSAAPLNPTASDKIKGD